MASDASSAVPKGTAAALQLVKCKVSASLMPGNLVAGSKHFAYIHRNEIALVEQRLVALGNEKAESTKVVYAEKEPINQVEFLKFAGLGEVLVAVNQGGGVFVFDESGQKLLHSYKHVKSGGVPSLKEQHLRGVCCDGKEGLYVGTGSGEILLLQITKTKMTLNKVIPASADGHLESAGSGQGGVSALAYSVAHSTLVSADDWGNVLFWAGSGDSFGTKPVARIAGQGSPANCLAQGHGVLAAAFASGHVRLYDIAKRQITVEIAAHTRSINALDIHATRPLLLAASEDTFVSVWSLPTDAAPSIKSLMVESPALGLLTGCRFGGANQELIITTIYDSRALAIMHTP